MNETTVRITKSRVVLYSLFGLASAALIFVLLCQLIEISPNNTDMVISFKVAVELTLLLAIITLSIVVDYYSRKERKFLRSKLKESKLDGSFISATSHEMEASYHSIFSIINLLSREEKKQSFRSIGMLIDDLRAACKESKNTIDNILEYWKKQAGIITPVMYKPIDIRFLLENIAENYEPLAKEKKVKITIRIPDELPKEVMGDERKMRHIIVNLLHNAIKFTPNDSEVLIAVSYKVESLIIRIIDEGAGISYNDTEIIFQPFATKNPDGLGLGLFVVKELATAINGTVEVNSFPDKGAQFVVHIPMYSLTSNF